MDSPRGTPRPMGRLGGLLVLTLVSCGAPPLREVEQKRLEESIVAPCCWRDTLATHDSAPARELRAAVRARMERGETREAILADLERQYGARIRAAPAGFSFTGFGVALLVAPLAGGVLLLRRATGRGRACSDDGDDELSGADRPSRRDTPALRELEDRLDDEIAALD